MSEKDVQVIRALFAAQNDIEAVYALFDPDIEWEDVSGLWAADWGKPRGKEAVYAAFTRWFEIFGDVEFTADEITKVGADHLVITRVKCRARRSGVPVEQRIPLLFTVRSGLIARVRAYRDRSAALEAVRGPLERRPPDR